MLRQVYHLFERHSYEAFVQQRGFGEGFVQDALADRREMECIGCIEIRAGIENTQWFIEALVRPPLNPWSDVRDGLGMPGAIFYARKGHHSNVISVSDINISDQLEGLGFGSWLLNLSRDLMMPLTGPDPWITGSLSSVDAHNLRRDLFWERHVLGGITVDENGNGDFLGPWMSGYNDALRKFSPLLTDNSGERPARSHHEGMLFNLEGRLAFKSMDWLESQRVTRNWEPIWDLGPRNTLD